MPKKGKKQLATKHVVHRKLKIEQHEICGIVTEYLCHYYQSIFF
jgi:hypothetical protein